MRSRPFVAGLLLSLLGGCTEKGRSLVLVDVSADPGLQTIREVRVAVSATATGRRWSVMHAWSGDQLRLGIYLPTDVQGTITTTACGLDAGGQAIAFGVGDPTTVTVAPGGSTPEVFVTLSAGAGSQIEACAIADASVAGDAALF